MHSVWIFHNFIAPALAPEKTMLGGGAGRLDKNEARNNWGVNQELV